MPRVKQTVRTISKHISLPEDLVARMELELFSEVEGKIPVGAQQELFTRLLREHLDKMALGRSDDDLLAELAERNDQNYPTTTIPSGAY